MLLASHSSASSDDGEIVHTKSIKKYVVRGRGRAQPTHLATKGKSRYGSRLRLQKASVGAQLNSGYVG